MCETRWDQSSVDVGMIHEGGARANEVMELMANDGFQDIQIGSEWLNDESMLWVASPVAPLRLVVLNGC